MQFMMERAVKEEQVLLLKNKSKFLKAHTSCGHKRAIEEMLTCPDLVGALGDVKAAEEVGASPAYIAHRDHFHSLQ